MIPLQISETIKAAQLQAHRDVARVAVCDAARAMSKLAAGELAGELQSTTASASLRSALRAAQEVASDRPHPSALSSESKAEGKLMPAAGRGYEPPVAVPEALGGLEAELEKDAFLGRLLALGRRGASALAQKGGVLGRVGRTLERPVRNPLKVQRFPGGGAAVDLRSPLGRAPIRTSAPVATPVAMGGGPYRAPGRVLGPAEQAVQDVANQAVKQQASSQAAKQVGGAVKPAGLIRTVLPGALLGGSVLGLGYATKKGIDFATSAAENPMAYNLGNKQFQYGYDPDGQANF